MQTNHIPAQPRGVSMQKTDEVIKPEIYKTTDYSVFRDIVGNREISQKHVLNLVRAITKKNMLQGNPIIVTKDMRVVDGQHRLAAARVLKTAIYYTIVDEASLEDIQLMNTTTKTWSGHDYLRSYASLGKEEYKIVLHYYEKTGIILSNLVTIFSGALTKTGMWTTKPFKEGHMKIPNLKESEDFVIDYLKFRSLVSPRVFNDREFVIALRRLFNDISADEFIALLSGYGRPIEYRATVKDYLRQFEEVVNWRQRKIFKRLF